MSEFFKASSPYPGGSARKSAVIDLVDCTAPPPTEVLGDRYIIDNTGGSVDAGWDGASKNDIVEFNGTVWIPQTPEEGWVAYVDLQDKDALFVDDGTPAWELRPVAITVHNSLTGLNDGNYKHLTATEYANLSDFGSGTLAELNANISDATLLDEVVINANINATAKKMAIIFG